MTNLTYKSLPVTDEYGIQCRRLVPNIELPKLPFGSMWCEIEPGGHSLKHAHEDNEIFVVWTGRARVETAGQETLVGPGDAIHVMPDQNHEIFNLSPTEPFVCLSVYWVPGQEQTK